jgi:hypothetical protein
VSFYRIYIHIYTSFLTEAALTKAVSTKAGSSRNQSHSPGLGSFVLHPFITWSYIHCTGNIYQIWNDPTFTSFSVKINIEFHCSLLLSKYITIYISFKCFNWKLKVCTIIIRIFPPKKVRIVYSKGFSVSFFISCTNKYMFLVNFFKFVG